MLFIYHMSVLNYLEEDNAYLKDLNKLIDSLELEKFF